jgi:hypothetical protein
MLKASEGEIAPAYAAWDVAFAKGDAKAIAALYADDAIFLPATHDVIKGPSGVEKFFVGIFGMGVTGQQARADRRARGRQPRLWSGQVVGQWQGCHGGGSTLGRHRDPHLRAAGRRQPQAKAAHIQLAVRSPACLSCLLVREPPKGQPAFWRPAIPARQAPR